GRYAGRAAESERRAHGAFPDAARGRGVPLEVPDELHETDAARAGSANARRVRAARSVSHVQEGAPDHGAGAEQLVSGDRSESWDVRGHLSREAVGLSEDDAACVPLAGSAVAHRAAGDSAAGDAMTKNLTDVLAPNATAAPPNAPRGTAAES